ncbi:MAG: hypothetical protein L3J17_02960 [Candidatus Jettenia sp.]|nr:MAG: hypothetical protein L3J17_02960 [Candidatus Jettenia sp.]
MSIATALSQKIGKNLPWKTVKDVISAALQAHFLEVAEESDPWPCDFPSAKFAVFKQTSGAPIPKPTPRPNILVADTELDPAQIQDLGDIIPKLLEIKAKANTPIKFQIRIEIGDGKILLSSEYSKEINMLLNNIKEGFRLS